MYVHEDCVASQALESHAEAGVRENIPSIEQAPDGVCDPAVDTEHDLHYHDFLVSSQVGLIF